jgi:hypothetical protein
MNEFQNRIRPGWQYTLKAILERAGQMKAQAVLAFDLDSTLFDNRPRQARIVRELGQSLSLAALTRCAPEHWDSGWDMKAAMRNCGLEHEEVERVYPEAKAFWAERFFTSPYCTDDIAIEGAVTYVNQVVATGARVAYVTGRHEAMREGSVAAMKKVGMATPGGLVDLIMKPNLSVSDDEWKREAHTRLDSMGSLLAAFDNEPTHVNDYKLKFPRAWAIHLATDHSGRPVPLHDEVISVPHFGIDS